MTFQRSLLGLPSIGQRVLSAVAFDPRWRKTEIQRIQSNSAEIMELFGDGQQRNSNKQPADAHEIAIVLNVSETSRRYFRVCKTGR